MAVGFGFSVSDICTGLKIIRDSVGALNDTKGAAADFSKLSTELQSLQDGLEAVQDLQDAGGLTEKQSAALDRSVRACQESVQEFLTSISKYQPHLREDASGIQSKFRKIKWALCKKEDVTLFRTELGRQAGSINMLLISFHAKQNLESRRSVEAAKSTIATLGQGKDNPMVDMLSAMSLEQRQCFTIVMKQNEELMQTVQDMRRMLQMQIAVPPQVLLQQPVVLLDPFGRLAPFHLEFVDSPECFIAVLKARFAHAGVKPAGLSKLDNREFLLEDTRRKKSVDLTKKWDRVWQPGEQYDMRMVFHRFACPPSTCPSCHGINEEEEDQVHCHGCGLQYQNIRAISKQSREWSRHMPKGAKISFGGEEIPYLLRHPKGEAELKIFRPSTESEDELYGGYRRVQIISQSLALLDQRFPALLLIEDFARFGELVRDVPNGVSCYTDEIMELHDRALKYIWEQQNNLPAFSSFSHIEQMRKGLTKVSQRLRQDIDALVRKLCEDPDTKDLMIYIKQRWASDQMTGYYTGVLMRMVNLSEFAKSREAVREPADIRAGQRIPKELHRHYKLTDVPTNRFAWAPGTVTASKVLISLGLWASEEILSILGAPAEDQRIKHGPETSGFLAAERAASLKPWWGFDASTPQPTSQTQSSKGISDQSSCVKEKFAVMKVKHRQDYMDPRVFQRNRLPPRAYFLPHQTLLLSGRWRFYLAGSPLDAAPDSKNDAFWSSIDVPGHWELQGFGRPQYTNFVYPFPADPPNIPSENPTGYYETTFAAPSKWESGESRNHRLRFEGVDSAFRVLLNGKEVGYSQGRSNAAEFDISHLIKGGSSAVNRLRVIVYKWSDGSYIEDQDMWWLSGKSFRIFRDVYLLAFPKQVHIEDFFVRTSFDEHMEDATIKADIILEFADEVTSDAELSFVLSDDKGEEVASAKIQQLSPERERAQLVANVSNPLKWTAETPHLYRLNLTLCLHGHVLQSIEQQVGFRIVEISGGLLRVNRVPIEIRGVNRHDHHPRFGRAVPVDFIRHDLVQMKKHNINALRCSHYPNDPRLLALANELGLYVMDEADLECHGMGVDFGRLPSADPAWKDAYVDRMQNLIHRDKNHPCVIMWSLGNESWYGECHQAMYDWSKKFDPTRPVHYENDHEFRASDVISYMYTGTDQLANLAIRDGEDYEKPIILCEYLHAMGTGPGGAKEYMETFRKYRRLQGGFVWEWANHGLLKKLDDGSGRSFYGYGGDFGDEPNDGNFVMDGLCDSEHLPGPGLVELKQAYQPLSFNYETFDSGIQIYVKNLFNFADLDGFDSVWTVRSYSQDGQASFQESGRRSLYGIGPGDSKGIVFMATESLVRWKSDAKHSELWLSISIQTSATSGWAQAGHEIAREDFCLHKECTVPPLPSIERLEGTNINISGSILTISSPTFVILFDKILAKIVEWKFKGQDVLCGKSGPQLTFWRAPTDNDKGGPLGEWKGHRVHKMEHQIRGVDQAVDKESGALQIHVTSYIAPAVLAWGFMAETKYTVHGDGKIQINIRAIRKGPGPETLPRIGLEMKLPKDRTTCEWFGRGPGQTYRDMKEAGVVGIWKQPLDDMMHICEMPQENGNRTETRWVKVVNERGLGLRAVLQRNHSSTETLEYFLSAYQLLGADGQPRDERSCQSPVKKGSDSYDQKEPKKHKGFDFAISKYTAADLDQAQHPHELNGSEGVVFRIDHDHHGIGTAACGPDVLDQHKLKTRDFDFTVSLEPISD